MKLSFVDASFESLGALAGLDAVCLVVFEDERPLRGFAGVVDWRLCGMLSRFLQSGFFSGAIGDALLFPAQRPFCAPRVFCFGGGRRDAFTRAAFINVVQPACDALRSAGCREVAFAVPQATDIDAEVWARVFLTQGLTRFRGERAVVVGEDPALARAFEEAHGRIKGVELEAPPIARS